MTRQQFLIFSLGTAVETYLFNQAIFDQEYFFAGFWAFLLIRKLYTSLVLSRVMKAIDKTTKK